MEPGVDVVDFRESDLSSAWALWLGTGWNEKYQVSEAEFARSWRQSPISKCIRSDGRVIAMARAVSDGVMYAMVHDVVVDSGFRGTGLGAKLIRALLDELQASGVRCIQLMSAENQSAFYEKLGFEARPANKPGMEFRSGQQAGC